MIALWFAAALSTCQVEPAPVAEPPVSRAEAGTDVGPDIVVEGQSATDDPVVCEMQVRTGSIVRRRVCRAQSEIEREQEDSQFRLRNMRRWGHIRERTVM